MCEGIRHRCAAPRYCRPQHASSLMEHPPASPPAMSTCAPFESGRRLRQRAAPAWENRDAANERFGV
eukprot:6433968-Prymnesium_polylepis.1